MNAEQLRVATDPDQITRNFHMREASVSASHPHLVRPVPERFRSNVVALYREILQPIRDHVREAVVITSLYRPHALNAAVGGSAESQHTRAEAADIHTRAMPVQQVFEDLVGGILPVPCGQVIYYPDSGFIHIALPSFRYPRPSFHLHRPARGFLYAPVAHLEVLRRVLAA